MKKSIKIILLIAVACLLIIYGYVKTNQMSGDYIVKSVNATKLNETTDEFLNQRFDHLWQYQFDQEYDIENIHIDYYNQGEKRHSFFYFDRTDIKESIPNIQYMYVGLTIEGNQIIVSVYLYAPKEDGDDYSMSVESSQFEIEGDINTRVRVPLDIKKNKHQNKIYLDSLIIDNFHQFSNEGNSYDVENLINDGQEIITIVINENNILLD